MKCRSCDRELEDDIKFDLGWHCDYPCDTVTYLSDEIDYIIPPKPSRGRAISAGKLSAKIKRLSGVNEDLLGKKESFYG